ncbi:MAG TPA: class I SAM-dependent methyltransferase [Candidatus Limnocylindrales bacterium]|jgi:SAM-dependent methyltransferase
MSDNAELSSGSLAEKWDAEADNWVAWARKPGHDSYWQFHRDLYRRLLPEPAGRVLDVGCGEGRLPRDLKSWGYDVVGVDASATLIDYAREADPGGDYHVADAAELPFPDAAFGLVSAFMSLQDVDRYGVAIREAARVLGPGGSFCFAITHPMQTAGEFHGREPDAPFVITGSYFDERRVGGKPYVRDGMSMTFHSVHRPLQDYVAALAEADLAIDRLFEWPDLSDPPGHRWRRMPMFLDCRAKKI